jgi:hypothetical protein
MAKTLPNFITEDEDVVVPGDNQIKSIATLVETMLGLEANVEASEEDLRNLKEKLRRVTEVDIPEAMTSAGATKLSMKDGSVLSVTTRYKVNISKERKSEAIDWLIHNGQDGLVRTVVVVELPKGDMKRAAQLCEQLTKMGVQPVALLDVNHASVEATVNELIIEHGIQVPEKTFGIYKLNRAKLKKPKRKS